jgi:hypothetical protein
MVYLHNQYGPRTYPKFRKHLKTEIESSLRNVVFKIKITTMDKVQKHINCTNS